MKKFDHCISCNNNHTWTEEAVKLSFHKAVCESCLEKLRENKFNDDWSLTMGNRVNNLLTEKN